VVDYKNMTEDEMKALRKFASETLQTEIEMLVTCIAMLMDCPNDQAYLRAKFIIKITQSFVDAQEKVLSADEIILINKLLDTLKVCHSKEEAIEMIKKEKGVKVVKVKSTSQIVEDFFEDREKKKEEETGRMYG